MDEEELTAYHEAGHAYMAICLGGSIECLTLEPEQDDALPRYGLVSVRWPVQRLQGKDAARHQVWVALSGPVAEIIISGERLHPATVPQWQHDWQAAWEAAASDYPDPLRRTRWLEMQTLELESHLRQDEIWEAVARIVDHLQAFETLEDDVVREILDSCR